MHLSSKRSLNLLGFLCVLAISACMPGIKGPAEDRSPAFRQSNLERLVGATKSEVIENVGWTRFKQDEKNQTYFVYQEQVVAGGMLLFPAPIPVLPSKTGDFMCSKLEFAEDGRLVAFELSGGLPNIDIDVTGNYGPPNCVQTFWSQEELQLFRDLNTERFREAQRMQIQRRQTRHQLTNEEGRAAVLNCLKTFENYGPSCDPDIIFVQAQDLSFAEGWLLICVAANLGHARARHKLGEYFHWGFSPVSKDFVASYSWYILAEEAGFSKAVVRHAFWGKQITPAQIAAAERLAAEWQPNPAECEAYEVAGE